MSGPVNACAVARPTLMQRLFPSAHLPPPEESPAFAAGYIHTDVVMVVDWRDRLRLLVSGKLHIQVKTQTDVAVRRSRSTSIGVVLPPTFRAGVDRP